MLNPQLLPLVRSQVEEYCREHFKDQTVVDIETTEAIAGRFLKWGRWFLIPATGLITVLALILAVVGVHDYSDVHRAAQQAVNQANTATTKAQEAEAKAGEAVKSIEQTVNAVKGQYLQLQSDADKYRRATHKVEELQKELNDAKGDWSKLDLTVHSLKTTAAPGESHFLGFGEGPCISSHEVAEKKMVAAYCVNGLPLSLFQATPNGVLRAVSSFSPSGFQDLSVAPKPTCDTNKRGTLYVEKGTGQMPDRPFLCARESDGSFVWLALSLAQ